MSKNMKDYFFRRALETSTWRGVIMLITGILGFGVEESSTSVYAEAITHLIFFVFLVCGAIGIALPDNLQIKDE